MPPRGHVLTPAFSKAASDCAFAVRHKPELRIVGHAHLVMAREAVAMGDRSEPATHLGVLLSAMRAGESESPDSE